MKLRVHIVCPDCGATAEVWMLDGWDIEKVAHHCDARRVGQVLNLGVDDRSHSVQQQDFPRAAIHVHFDPPRPVY